MTHFTTRDNVKIAMSIIKLKFLFADCKSLREAPSNTENVPLNAQQL